MLVRPLRVAVLATNNARDYSGGRYHGLMAAYALAAAGADVRFITNRRPVFLEDLEGLAPGAVTAETTNDWNAELAGGSLDYVVVVPTGIFHPEFYEAALSLAADSGARIVLINFESGNWFNEMAPEPRDPALWDYWRRLVAEGGLVLSSARTSDIRARQFYASQGAQLRFEVWSPAINSVAARQHDDAPFHDGVVAFVRSTDGHKGALDLLQLDPAILEGRTLHIVAGNDHDPGFIRELRDRFVGGGGGVEFHVRPHDDDKFRLLSGAKALVFPSRFEGFGYPPVEAAFAGAEIAAYDLPVLRETVGSIAHFAPRGDVEALGRALVEALAAPPRRALVRAAVETRVDFAIASSRLCDILWRNLEAVRPRAPRGFRILWGPPRDTMPRRQDDFDPLPTDLPMPEEALECRWSRAGEVLLSLRLRTRRPIAVITAGAATQTTLAPVVLAEPEAGGRFVSRVVAALAKSMIGQAATFEIGFDDGSEGTVMFTVQSAAPMPETEAPTVALIGLDERADTLELTIRVESAHAVSRAVAIFDGSSVVVADVKDALAVFVLPAGEPVEQGMTVYLLRDFDLVDVLDGYPPSAGFRRASLRGPGEVQPRPRKVAVAGTNDQYWTNGVARFYQEPYLGAMSLQHPAGPVTEGTVVRLASGRLRRVAAVREKKHAVDIYFHQTVSPVLDGYPHSVEVLPLGDDGRKVRVIPRSDEMWWNGVFVFGKTRARRGVLLDVTVDAVSPGAVIRFAGDVSRSIVAVQPDPEGTIAWLDGSINALDDGSVKTVSLATAMPKAGHATIIAMTGSRRIGIGVSPGAEIVRGSVLRWPNGERRRVVAVAKANSATNVELDAAPPPFDPYNNEVGFDALVDRVDGGASTLLHGTPHEVSGLLPRLIEAAQAEGADLPVSAQPQDDERPRILFCTLVPMTPVDQGNRIVTFRLVAHLVELGFDVDVILQGDELPGEFIDHFGDRVRVVSAPFPDWTKAESAETRRSILRMLEEQKVLLPIDRAVLDQLKDAAARYHPFFVVSDAVVKLALGLYRRHDYAAIVCNYAHMVRVAKELETVRPLPPTVIVTHDALSRLPLSFDGKPLDTQYRYCSPEMERDTLNAVENAVVLAISENERQYYQSIGVTNPVLLCEYDGFPEFRSDPVPDTAYASKRLIFHASANPMNVAAMNWFVENCWRVIRARVPDARLVVCGKISRVWNSRLPGIEHHGVVSRAMLLELLHGASVAINPTVAGTGLKIKTVEAACLGLPSVCLPHAVDGLEAVADRFAIVAADGPEFTAGCISLLTDERRWLDLHRSALALAVERFDSEPVYRELDQAMGWRAGCEARRLAARRPRQSGVENQTYPLSTELVLARGPAEPAALAALGMHLATIGQLAAARPLLEQAVVALAGGKAASLHAGRIALEFGDGWAAACHGAAAVAADPVEPAGYRLIAQGLLLCGQDAAAVDAAIRAVHASPGDSESLDLCATLARVQQIPALKRFVAWQPKPFKLEVGEVRPFIAASGAVGLGWAHPENWGCWTSARQARLLLRSAGDGGHPLVLKLQLHAAEGGDGQDQLVDVFVNGAALGVLHVPRTEEGREFGLPLPADSFRGDGLLTLDFWIHHPAVKRQDGQIVDTRLLGIALSTVGLARISNGAAVTAHRGPHTSRQGDRMVQ